MIFGAHVVVFSADATADREFFRDVLGFPSVDAGGGWLIFALPPAELAVHPAGDDAGHELYLMCDDLGAEIGAPRREGGPLLAGRGGPVGLGDQDRASRGRARRPVRAQAPLADRAGRGLNPRRR